MLHDRICTQGGWNAGNGVVYGTPLTPHPDATALALLALSGQGLNDSITASLNWLEYRAETLVAPWSLAWAVVALRAFGRPTQRWIETLCTALSAAEIDDCATLAIMSLALHRSSGLNILGTDG
jgi:hypothetical protein